MRINSDNHSSLFVATIAIVNIVLIMSLEYAGQSFSLVVAVSIEPNFFDTRANDNSSRRKP